MFYDGFYILFPFFVCVFLWIRKNGTIVSISGHAVTWLSLRVYVTMVSRQNKVFRRLSFRNGKVGLILGFLRMNTRIIDD